MTHTPNQHSEMTDTRHPGEPAKSKKVNRAHFFEITTQKNERPWYQSPIFTHSLWAVTATGLIVTLFNYPNSTDNRLTLLILKRDSCAYLQQQQFAVQPYGMEGGCTFTAPFRPNVFDNGGFISAGTRHLNISENQIVAREVIKGLPWTTQDIQFAIWLGINFCLTLASTVWLFISL